MIIDQLSLLGNINIIQLNQFLTISLLQTLWSSNNGTDIPHTVMDDLYQHYWN